MDFAKKIIPKEPIIIAPRNQQEIFDRIAVQFQIRCNSQEKKFEFIREWHEDHKDQEAIVYCNVSLIEIIHPFEWQNEWYHFICSFQTSETVNSIVTKLYNAGADYSKIGAVTENSTYEDRSKVLESFRTANTKMLITTSILHRGIDIEKTLHTVNFDLPVDQLGKANYDTYLRRINCTGSLGKSYW